jgi:hypothetical protein
VKVFVDCAKVVGRFDREARNTTHLCCHILLAMASARREYTNIHMLGEDEEEAPRRAGSKPVFEVFLSIEFISWARADGRVDVRK